MTKKFLEHLWHIGAAMIILYMLSSFAYWVTPVNVFSTLEDTELNDDVYTGHVKSWKVLQCSFVPGSLAGYGLGNNGWQERLVWFINDNSPDSSKPARWFEKQSFGRTGWKIKTGDTAVRYTVTHNCDGDIRITVIGPFPINY